MMKHLLKEFLKMQVRKKNADLLDNWTFILMEFFRQWFMDMTAYHIKKQNNFQSLHDF